MEKSLIMLKEDRDTWREVAKQYKEAFEAQTNRLLELQNICVATQAELENERLIHRRGSYRTSYQTAESVPCDGRDSRWLSGTDWLFTPLTRQWYNDVEKSLSMRLFTTALFKIDRSFCGTLSYEAQLEGILLKSTILRSSDSNLLHEALAQCTKAMQLCDRHSRLEIFRTKVHFFKAVCLFQLGMFPQARLSFAAVDTVEFFHEKAQDYIVLCDLEEEEEKSPYSPKRRSAFEGQRTITDGYLDEWKRSVVEVSIGFLQCQLPPSMNISLCHCIVVRCTADGMC